MHLTTLRERIFRTKNLPPGSLETQLKRCLNTFDITLLGVGHMIGAGIYVMTGAAAREIAGPSIVLSFLLAGIAALLSALCYAEFGARFPKAGSAYTYAYVGVGELWAFIIGWNIILEHMLSAAAVSRAWSGYLNALTGDRISNFTAEHIVSFEGVGFVSDYPDFVAFFIVILVGIFIALGSKTSVHFNTFFTCTNLAVITVVVGWGMTYADFGNWTGSDASGKSTFFPFGISGTFQGAASCFFAYIGFDGLATAGEEAKNPAKAIPHSTFISMTIVTTAYILMAATLTLMVPYQMINPAASFSDAFALHGANVPRIIVSVGALCGMTTSLVGSMFALPRCVYAMADDGLLFRWFSVVNKRTQVPFNAVAVFTILTAIIALFFDLSTLVEFLSIGTLLAYSIVSACVIILRYQPTSVAGEDRDDIGGKVRAKVPLRGYLERIPLGQAVWWGMGILTLSFSAFILCFTTSFFTNPAGIVIAVITGIVAIVSIIFIWMHHQNELSLSFKVQFVPLLPAASLCINIVMMLNLQPITWVRFVVWMLIGGAIYFGYGIRHSSEEKAMAAARLSNTTTYDSMVKMGTDGVKVNGAYENKALE